METALIKLLAEGKLSVETLLALIVVGILTKRIVPWWVYDHLEQKYKEVTEKVKQASQNGANEYRRGYLDALKDVKKHRDQGGRKLYGANTTKFDRHRVSDDKSRKP